MFLFFFQGQTENTPSTVIPAQHLPNVHVFGLWDRHYVINIPQNTAKIKKE